MMKTRPEPLFPPGDRRKAISITELALILGLDTETIRRDAVSGAIPGAFQRKPRSQWRFKRSVLEAWWAKK